MAWTKVLLHRPEAGVTTYFHSHGDGRATIETVQHDVSPILEWNKFQASEIGKNTRGRDMFKIASVPPGVQLLWIERHGVDPTSPLTSEENWPIVQRLLNSNEWRYLRTSEVHL